MSTAVFERLLYTDCRAGQGRGGGAGFQIQAQSPGVTAGLARLAVNTLLYAAPTEWLTTRAVDDFPLGMAHAAGEGWATAQSRYLGKEVTGSRSGNHLADCLLTTDHEPYGAIRPAQLFESEVWREVPFETIECPSYDGFLEPGPLSNDDIQEWLRENDARVEVLGRLVTALEDPKGPQVVIVALTTEEAVRWIAAATVLLPIKMALDVTFKVFVTDLNRSPQRVVAVSKELNPTIAPDSLGSKFVIDATTGQSSGGPTSERASYWVERLLEADDPYDVVEAVDFAHLLTAGDQVDTVETRETAWLITVESAPVTSPGPVVRWLREPKDPELELGEHESAAANRLIASGLADAGTLIWMERQVDADRLYVNRAELRQALLTAELGEVETALATPSGDLTPVDVGDGPRRDAESAISSALLLTTDGDVVDRLLRIARRHRVPLAVSPLRDRLRAFVGDWIADPARSYDPGMWALSECIVEELATQLTAEDQPGVDGAPDLSRVRPLLAQAWPYLLQVVTDPLAPLAWELLAASIDASADRAKESEIKRVTGRLKASSHPEQALAGLQDALVRWRTLSRRDAMAFVDSMPLRVRLRTEISDEAIAEVRRRVNRPDRLVLDVIRVLDDRRILPFSVETDELATSDRLARDFLERARALRSMRHVSRLPDLTKINPHVLRVRAPDFVEVSLEDASLPLLGAVVLDAMPVGQRGHFLDSWSRRLGGERGLLAAARGYVWSESPASALTNTHRQVIADGVAGYASSLPDTERASWIHAVEGVLEPGEAAGFEPFLGGIKRHTRLPTRSRRPAWDELDEEPVASVPPPAQPPADEPADGKRSWLKGRPKRD